jgi:hypothetical protein
MDKSLYFQMAPSYEPGLRAKKAVSKTVRNNKGRKGAAKPAAKRGRTMKLPPVRFHPHTTFRFHPAPTAKKSTKASALQLASFKRTVKEIRSLSVFLISAHACLCPFESKCFGADIPPTFELPKQTFTLSFSQAGDATCVHDPYVIQKYQILRDYLYLHSQGDINNSANVGTTKFSMFSGMRRAVGPTEYPNINFTLNDAPGTARKDNPYGVYELTSKAFTNALSHETLNNTLSILSEDASRTDWTLQQIIQEVYAKKKISSALFIIGGCLTSCNNPDKAKTEADREKISADLTRHGLLQDIANNEYTNRRHVYTLEEIQSMKQYKNIVPNIPVSYLQSFPQPGEYREMLKAGLMTPVTFKTLPEIVHHENRAQLEKEFKFKFDAP